jgi:hypothetical protein
MIDPEDLEEPSWMAVATISDAEKAVAALQRIAEDDAATRDASPGTEEVEGVTLNTRGNYGYFTVRNRIAFGELKLLRGAAARVKTPATLRYGTVECLATEPDEVVALVYGGRLLPLMESVLPVLGANPDQAALAAAQFKSYEKMFDQDDDDPIVATLAHSGDRLAFEVRADTATHPGMLEITGPARPLRLAALLPETTEAMLSFRFNDEFKAQLMNEVVPAVQASGDPDVVMQVAMASQFLNQLGDEATIGIAGLDGSLPEVYLMLGLAEPEATQGVLQMFLPMSPFGDESGVSINKVDTPENAPPIYLSFLSDFALACTSEFGIRSVIKQHASNTPSGFFALLQPPFDNSVPRYQAAIIKSRIVQTLLSAAAMFSGEAPPAEEFMPIVTAVRELRTGKTMSGTWMTGHLTVYLGDLEAAAALRASAATGESMQSTDESDGSTDTSTESDVPAESAPSAP